MKPLPRNGDVRQAIPFPLHCVRLTSGLLKQRQDIHAEYLLSIDPDRLLAPFRAQAGLPPKAERYGGWESRDISGHSLGHYLSALSLLYASAGADWARTRVTYIVNELALCQQSNGDGYVLPVSKNAFDDLRQGILNVSPFAMNGVWVPFYTLHKVLAGLRDAYRLTANAIALDISRQVANWLGGILENLSATQIQEMLRAEHGGMNEVLADLSADTGEHRYLRMAERGFHDQRVLAPMFRGEDRLAGLHGNTQIPKVIGLACEYELTRNAAYHTAATTFWDHVVNRRSYAIGGHGESEHFFPVEQFPHRLTPNTCETCNTYNMMKLTGRLFSWAPRAEYMDFAERALFNHLAANIGRQQGEFGYFLGLGSVGVKAFSTPFDSWWCCVGTGLENPPRYGEWLYFHDTADTLWINLYTASTLQWEEKGVQVIQETNFPEGESIQLTIHCNKPAEFELRLRHPDWCNSPRLAVNRESISVPSTPGSYIPLRRTWADGDVVRIILPMRLRAESLPQSGGAIFALMHGPTVLAAVVPDEPGTANPAAKRFSEHLEARGKTDTFPPVFVADSSEDLLAKIIPHATVFGEFTARGAMKPADLRFIPFHRIYEEQYAVYFPLFAPGEWNLRQMEIQTARQHQQLLEAATIDMVTPGYQQPEVEHGLREKLSEHPPE